MAGETKRLAEFAVALRYEDIPAPVIAITKACLIDAVGVSLFGSRLPWGKSVADFVYPCRRRRVPARPPARC